MHLPDWTKNFVDTDEAAKPEPVASHTVATGTSAPVTVVPSVPPVTDVTPTAISDHSDDAYQKLFAKTDYTTSAVFQKIRKYLDPIASMALDDKTKFNIALQQAKTQEGISADTLMNVFEQCKAALAQAATDFQGSVQAAMAAQVDSRKQKAEQLSAQIADLQSQVKQLTEDGFAMQQKIQAAQHQFEVALQTRQTELTQDQSKYATLVA